MSVSSPRVDTHRGALPSRMRFSTWACSGWQQSVRRCRRQSGRCAAPQGATGRGRRIAAAAPRHRRSRRTLNGEPEDQPSRSTTPVNSQTRSKSRGAPCSPAAVRGARSWQAASVHGLKGNEEMDPRRVDTVPLTTNERHSLGAYHVESSGLSDGNRRGIDRWRWALVRQRQRVIAEIHRRLER